MKNKYIKWLYKELPLLIKKGVLTSETAKRLEKHYGPVEKKGNKNSLLIVFGTLGALLIGGGIMLIFAHNWDNLSRATKTMLSFLPLIIAQILLVWVAIKKENSIYWKEGAAVFLAMAIGGTISLVSQVYHIGGDFGKFALTWAFLLVPVSYLLNTTFPVIGYLILITSWAGYARAEGLETYYYWPLLAVVFPYYYREYKKNKNGNIINIFNWVSVICLAVAVVWYLMKTSRDFGC
ncbi:MAG: hypothetical protein A2231_10330 [Candidatus Firestonebacteria bacterium RIFOXYA2_FULL_40_8]|nr:MAG: hypothetical protein A2231_10330 [Candidatus Firestonebacteria bacterium RIFOXYA2_FULL_40_8]